MNVNPMFQNSAHRDVLEAAIPDSDSSRRGLLEELKNRGRSAVGGNAWPDAAMLYEKALKVAEALAEDPSSSLFGVNANNERAILYSNLSLVLGKMGQWDRAKSNAQAATELDRTYIKGWWRLGQAMSSLKEFDGAVEAMEKASLLDPNNKALTKELNKLREEAAKAPMEIDEKENGPKTEPAPPRSEIYKPKATPPKKSSSASTSKEPSTVEKMDIEEEDKNLFSKSEPVRGYKIVNGKKTSYFHNELSEEAKQLIGDIAPKKLDPAALATSSAPSSAPGDKSSWNHAGTWEERDVTAWAKESLKEFLQKATYTFPDSSPAPGAVARIEKVAKVDGHASFATVRTKKTYIYEFAIELEWTLDLPSEPDAVKGKMSFPDIDGTCELGAGYEMTKFEITDIDEQSLRPVVDRFVKHSGLRDSVHEAIDNWVKHFREKY